MWWHVDGKGGIEHSDDSGDKGDDSDSMPVDDDDCGGWRLRVCSGIVWQTCTCDGVGDGGYVDDVEAMRFICNCIAHHKRYQSLEHKRYPSLA